MATKTKRTKTKKTTKKTTRKASVANKNYKNLLIVESPSKAHTINKYLGKDYKVMATVGHIIDLPKSKLGVDIENGYEPMFETIHGKGKVITDLKRAIPKDGNVYIATDPDREGEAIAWHVANALKLKDAKRVTFHEVTESAINDALKHVTTINTDLVDAQKARRVLDRLVGYKLSEIIWKKIWYGLSAGRVQSAALRLIVEKEEERERFVPEEFWNVSVKVLDDDNNQLIAQLQKRDGRKYLPKSKEEVEELENKIGDSDFIVKDIVKKNLSKHAYPPFTTSTLQQSAYNTLGFTSKRTMTVAQALYQAGYITYMRTDSVNLSTKAVDAIRSLVSKRYGKEYIPEKPNYYKVKSKNAQEAHEAIRPTDFAIAKDRIEKEMDASAAKLYDLIWRRAVSSQMTEKKVEQLTVSIVPKDLKSPEYTFILGGEKTLFDGFRRVLTIKTVEDDLQEISKIEKKDILKKKEFINEQKFTQPPARFTEASLIKELERLGIGRPSTYATIISTLLARGYVVKDGKALAPVDIGRVVTHFLEKNFNWIVDYEYTAKVEDELDEISLGKKKYVPIIDKEYKPLVEGIEVADKNVDKNDVVILGDSEEKCPTCGSSMVVRIGRYGKFLSCSKFPECKGMKDLSGGEEALDYNKYDHPTECPKCKKRLVLKNGKYGKFWACEDYPNCKGIVPLLLKDKCPDCGHNLVERKGRWGTTFIGCSNYPDCKYIQKVSKKKKDEDEGVM